MKPYNNKYDKANGAPFGTFDFDNNGDLNILEKAIKLDHYKSLWNDEDNESDFDDNFNDDFNDNFDDDF